MPDAVRTYRVEVRGFDFDHVLVQARSHGRARTIVARSYADAGWGSMGDGYKHITSTRLSDALVELIYPRRGPEGFARATKEAAHV